jgi:hypothetical protein
MELTERQCAEPRCERVFIPTSSRNRYCLQHRKTKPRDPMHDVIYGTAHRPLGAQVKSRVLAGLAICARCGEPIRPDEPWDLDHRDDRRGYLAPSTTGYALSVRASRSA